MARTDIHAPSKINPFDYEYVCSTARADEGDPMGVAVFNMGQMEIFKQHQKATGGKLSTHHHGGTCHICGASAIYTAKFYHAKTNTYIITGHDCAEKMEMAIDGGMKNIFKQLRDEQKALRGVYRARDILKENDILDFVEAMFVDKKINGKLDRLSVDGYSNYPNRRLNDDLYYLENAMAGMVRSLIKYGDLSDKQWGFLKDIPAKIVDAYHAYADSFNENQVDVVTGKVAIEGEIISIKVEETYYGYQTRMLVKDKRGFKVWGTYPAALERVDAKRGDTVSFHATVQASTKDRSFGFFKRPTKAKVVTNA